MQRVFFHVFATVMSAVVLFGISSLAVYADFNPNPNPNNRGHHYGWSKHNHAPAPPPAPAPAPAPGGSGGHGSGVVTAAQGSGGAHPGAGLSGVHLNLPVLALVPTRQTADAGVNPVEPLGGDPWWWLVLLLPPALAALWAIAFRRVVSGRPAPRGGPAAAPA